MPDSWIKTYAEEPSQYMFEAVTLKTHTIGENIVAHKPYCLGILQKLIIYVQSSGIYLDFGRRRLKQALLDTARAWEIDLRMGPTKPTHDTELSFYGSARKAYTTEVKRYFVKVDSKDRDASNLVAIRDAVDTWINKGWKQEGEYLFTHGLGENMTTINIKVINDDLNNMKPSYKAFTLDSSARKRRFYWGMMNRWEYFDLNMRAFLSRMEEDGFIGDKTKWSQWYSDTYLNNNAVKYFFGWVEDPFHW
jgi:hypothetical protein